MSAAAGLSGAGAASFPWDEVLAFLLGRLRWRPEDVWQATPREVAAALPRQGPSPMRGADLRDLIARFPDA